MRHRIESGRITSFKLEKSLLTVVLSLLALVMLSGCATAEERAARAAEQAAKVKIALTERQYKIGINRMYPMKGSSKSVSASYAVEVRNDSLISYLPYIGRAYQVPYGGGKGLNFSERIGSYQESQTKKGLRRIEIGVKNEEDTYSYYIDVFDNGNTSIAVQSREREPISFSGMMTFDE